MFVFTHLEPPLQEHYILFKTVSPTSHIWVQMISQTELHLFAVPCIYGNYQILTCGIFKYTPFHPNIVHVTLYGTE